MVVCPSACVRARLKRWHVRACKPHMRRAEICLSFVGLLVVRPPRLRLCAFCFPAFPCLFCGAGHLSALLNLAQSQAQPLPLVPHIHKMYVCVFVRVCLRACVLSLQIAIISSVQEGGLCSATQAVIANVIRAYFQMEVFLCFCFFK